MDDLREKSLALLKKGQADFGFNDAVRDREFAKALDPNWQVHLLDLIASVTQSPGIWREPRAILELGCGSGSFVVNALKNGHDAWGIDNDADRLAVAYARIDAFGLDSTWKERLIQGDASSTGFPPNRFDVVVGHQFIEHVPDPGGTIAEMLRITKRGGIVVLFAPDYRAPFEAHYEIPWPPFLSRELCKPWLDGFERPHGGIDGGFYYISLPQLIAIFEPMNCKIIAAYNDRKIEPAVWRNFDCSSAQATFECAQRFRAAFEARQLPENFMIATSLGIVAQKL